MIKEDKSKIIQGLVRHKNQWISLKKKLGFEFERQKKIKAGYVQLQGEWITIEEKIKLLTPTPEKKSVPQNITINKNDNRRVYNISHHHDHSVHQKTVTENKHLHLNEGETKHLHLNENELKKIPAKPVQTQKKLTGGQVRRLPLHEEDPPSLPRPGHLD